MDILALVPSNLDISCPKGPIRVLGIDLGTTNCTVAEMVWRPGSTELPQPRCLEIEQKTLEGMYTHTLVPSVVALYDGALWVGEGAKRLRARSADFGLDLYKNIFWECKNHMGIRRTYQRAPEGFCSAKDISGHLLQFLASAAASDGEDAASRVVVTVPASFQAAQRRDTAAAASLAGMELAGGDLLDEPVAAFLACAFEGGLTPLRQAEGPKNLLVFDFGGGTCDVAVFRLEGRDERPLNISPLAVSRYHRLGGGDIDLAVLFEVLIPQLIEQNGLSPHDLDYETKALSIVPALLGVAEALKIGLCREVARLKKFGRYDEAAQGTLTKKLPGVHHCPLRDGRQLQLQSPVLPAARFEEVLKPFLDPDLLYPRDDEYRTVCSIFAPLQDGLDRAGLDPENIDYCLLVGGSSLIPQVVEAVEKFFPRAQMLQFGDTEATQSAVARGAACQALMLALTGRGLVEPVAADGIYIRTARGPVELVSRGQRLPYPQDNGWAENNSLVVPRTSFSEEIQLRVEIIDSGQAVLASGVWKITPPVSKDDRLRLRYRLDENQVLDLQLNLADDEDRDCFEMSLENPLTNVVNPDAKREEIEELEEMVRTQQVAKSERPRFLERIAGLYAELGQHEKALNLLRHALRLKGGDVNILNRMGTLCGKLGDYQREERFFREAAAIAPHYGGTLFNLALSKWRQGQVPEGITAVEEAIARERDAPYFVLRALLENSSAEREAYLSQASELFGPVAAMSDWELVWFREAARLAGDSECTAQADEERKRRHRGRPVETPGGELPAAYHLPARRGE